MPASGLGAIDVRVRHAEHVMGTVVSFDVPGSARHDGSLDDAIGWLHWVDRVFSPYRADSEVSLLARAERSEERRVWKDCLLNSRSRWSPKN